MTIGASVVVGGRRKTVIPGPTDRCDCRAAERESCRAANESRDSDWPIWSDLATVLRRRARKLYASESLGIELDNTVYALDSSTVDLCLSLFDWAPFRSTKVAIKLQTVSDLRTAVSAFIHISDGKLHDVNGLDMLSFEAGSFYVMNRGYVDFAGLYTLHQAGAFFLKRATAPLDAHRVHSAAVDRATGVTCDQRVMFNGFLYSAKKYPEHLRRVRFNDPDSGKMQIFLTQNFNVADTLASQVRPGAGSKNRLLPSLTITEPAYLRANRLSTRAKPPSSHGPAFST